MADLATLVLETQGLELAIRPGPAQEGSPARRCPDMTRTVAVTGYKPKVDLREGLRQTWAWYENRLASPLLETAS